MSWPTVVLTEEGPREGFQIESASISTEDKVRIIDALSRTGLKRICVGSFVSPKWTPQMAEIDEIVRSFTPEEGVTYIALALNKRGQERAVAYYPKISPAEPRPTLECHLCDVFVRRNSNRSRQDEIDAWPEIVRQARASGATEAGIGINAAWGSNWLGGFSEEARMDLLGRQHMLWSEAGIPVTALYLGDPMSWSTPHVVEHQLEAIRDTWPGIREIYLHLHDARGLALTSSYAAMRVLDSSYTLRLDTSIGGMGGCPYCGNGQITGLVPTEDLVHMLREMGIDLGVDLKRLIDVVWLAEEVVGHKLWGRVSKAGPFPHDYADLYPMDLPFVETEEQARHFMLGAAALGTQTISPWKEPITSPERAALARKASTGA